MPRLAALLFSAALPVLLWPAPRPKAKDPRLHVPKGFVIEKVAGEPDVVFPMFAVFDDRGRLFVAESSGLDLYAELQAQTRRCRIRLLEDPDAHGRFRKSRVFADKLVFPMGLASRDGKLYVADPPNLVVLEDTKGRGRADRRTVILSGFGHKDNGSLHGLVFGPDGLLYMTLGHPDGFRFKGRDGKLVRGDGGALLRCRPDGLEPEVLCRGFENLVEIAFTPGGDIIGTDNWFQRPTGGMRDALVHLVEGGLYPLHRDAGTPLPVTGEPLPPVALYPAVALSGLMRYRGQGVPAALRGSLFSAQHNARKVVRHTLVASGSTFHVRDADFVTTDASDFHPSDVLEAPDGSLLILDTGSWYVHHCPTGKIRKVRAPGGIYRVRYARARPVADPLGLKIDWRRTSAKRLAELLGDRRPFVRDRARQTLVARGQKAVSPLAALLASPTNLSARQQAVWALAAISDSSALPPLRKSLRRAHPDLAATAARALALRKDRKSAPILVHLLGATAAPLRLAAAQALARCGDRKSLPALWKALAAEPDRFLEHALVHAVHHLADAAALEGALKNPSPRVQQAVLLLLDQPPRPPGRLKHQAVLGRVTSQDPGLRRTALGILLRHAAWSRHALGLLRDWLRKRRLTAEEQRGLRALLLAFQGQKAVQELVGATLADRRRRMPSARRVLLLEVLAGTGLSRLPSSWMTALGRAVRSADPAVRMQAVRTIAVLQVARFDDRLAQLAGSDRDTAALRLEALRALATRRSRLSDPQVNFLLERLADKQQPLARLAAAEVLARCRLTDAQLPRLLRALRKDTFISPTPLLPALRRSVRSGSAAALLTFLETSLRKGWRPPERDLGRLLDALPTAYKTHAAAVRALWKKQAAGQRARLAKFEALLKGGDPTRGRKVFFGQKVACVTCHRVGRRGGQIGPDLTKIGAVRAGRDLLESIVFPSSTIAQGYENYSVTTKSGRSFTGVVARQTPELVVLRDSSGADIRLRRDQIEVMRRLATSLMPEGLERALTKREFRDLLAFLQSLK